MNRKILPPLTFCDRRQMPHTLSLRAHACVCTCADIGVGGKKEKVEKRYIKIIQVTDHFLYYSG